MKLLSNLVALVISIVCLFAANSDCFAAWPAINIWLDNGMKKYRQGGEDGTSGSNALIIKSAKNEFEPFQILIYNDHATDPVTGVDVTVTQASGPGTISDIYIYKQLYINVTTVSRHDYSIGYWPDPLIPKVDRYYGQKRNAFPFDIVAKKVQGIWVDIGTTPTTPAGTYTFNIAVTKSGEISKTATVTLQVWNFALPSTPTLKSFMGLGSGYLATGHWGAYQGDTWQKAMMKLYSKALLYHRLAVNTLNKGRWFTNVDANGHVISWTDWDAQYGSLLDGTEITNGPLSGAKLPSVTIEFGNTFGTNPRDSSATNWVNYLQDWWNHFTTKGWDPMNRLYLYSWDEPKTSNNRSYRGSTYNEQQIVLIKCKDMNSVNTGGAGTWKNGFTTAGLSSFLHNPGSPYTSLDVTGFYFPVMRMYTYREPWTDSSSGYRRNTYPGYENWTTRNHGSYISNDGSHVANGVPDSYGVYGTDNAPDVMLETPSVLTRGYFWLQWYYRAHQFLYYETVERYAVGKLKPAQPYFDQMSWWGGNGDGTLFYPGVPTKTGRPYLPASTLSIGGTNDIPIESIRLKLLREGIEDREYMELARQARSIALIDTQVNSVFKSTTDPGPYYHIKTALDLLKAREGIANLLLNLTPPSPPKGLTVN